MKVRRTGFMFFALDVTLLTLLSIVFLGHVEPSGSSTLNRGALKQPHLGSHSRQEVGVIPHFRPKIELERHSAHHISGDHGLMGCYQPSDISEDHDLTATDGQNGCPANVLRFDGVNDYVRIETPSSFTPINVTLEGWVSFDSTPSGTRHLMGKTLGSGTLESFTIFWQEGSLKGLMSDASGYGPWLQYRWTPAPGTWYHMAYTFNDASDYQALYLNGQVVASGTVAKSIGYDSHPIMIGGEYESERLAYFLSGHVGEVRIWNVARSPSEIQSTMDRFLVGNEPGLVGYWKLDEGSGQVVYDSSASGNNGHLGSTSGIDGDDPTWATVNWPVCLHRILISVDLPSTTRVGSLVSAPVRLGCVHSADNLRGVQFSLSVTDTNALSPAVQVAPTMGDLFPSDSITSVTATSDGWDFILTVPHSPTEAISGTGVVVTLPFTAVNTGRAALTFTDHQLSDDAAQLIPHSASDAYLYVKGQGNVEGNTYLDWRDDGHYTNTQIVLIGPRETYTTTTEPSGDFFLTVSYSDTYALQASHALFVQASRTITVNASLTTTVPQIGLWAGDVSQDQDVDLYDWYLLAAAIYPVNDLDFDINDDGTTNIQDLVILEGNRGQPDMTTTNPPPRSTMSSQDVHSPMAVNSVGKLRLVVQDDGKMVLRLEESTEPIYAIGARIGLPAEATVSQVAPDAAMSEGFLQWHEDGDKLYVVIAPVEGDTVARDTDVAVVRGAAFAQAGTSIEASNIIAAREEEMVFLPIILK